MKNMKLAVSADGILTITVDLKHEIGLSATGKTKTVATSSGFAKIPGDKYEGISVSLNVNKKF